MIIPDKYPSQARTLELHLNLFNNQHCVRVTPIQRLRSKILLLKLPRKTNLVVPEEANTIYALILTLTTQKYTDNDVWKVLFQVLFVCHSYSAILLFLHTYHSTFFIFLYFGGNSMQLLIIINQN